MTNTKCSATTKAGHACTWTAIDATGFCASHHPDRARILSERGKAGAASRAEQAVKWARRSCSLRSVPDLLTELERALLLIEDSGGDKVQRATAICKVVGEARTLLMSDAERQAARLEKLLSENPTLAQRLKAVS